MGAIPLPDTAGMEPRAALAAMHGALAGTKAEPAHPAHGSVAARLSLYWGRPAPLTPPLARASMVPHPWGVLDPLARRVQSWRRQRRHWYQRRSDGNRDGAERQPWPAAIPDNSANNSGEDVVDGPDPRGRWQPMGNIRRIVLLILMLAQAALGVYTMSRVLPYGGSTPSEITMVIMFAILFCWVLSGFWTAMAGFLVLLRGDPFLISRQAGISEPPEPIPADARTAIVMPICNEDVTRVMAGLRATFESLARTGYAERFDFFVLSDSGQADIHSAELAAWAELCRTVDGGGRLFYRRRRRRVKRKSGNIDDFCRRWGKNYRYMIVLDADSVMSGACLTTLVRLMEANPGAGIIQTAPRAAGRETLYARIQQFATRLYGPLFTAGLHYWQLGESHYWGHNAIIRLAPFIRHCALAPLPGKGSLSGEILSHDFVEAALMRRAGWAVWIAYDLDGRYEEMPPNLLDELKRDRRWCHGNLMNFRLFAARGMHRVHRAVFVTGVMAYLSSPLWFLFLVLSTALLAIHTLTEPQYFPSPRQLFPTWPQWRPEQAILLFGATATLLFLPKVLAVLLVAGRQAHRFGGRLRLTVSMLAELLFSVLLAPVRMLFHTRFVLAALLGWQARWKSPPREDAETSWREAFGKHGLHSLLGLAWGAGVYLLNPGFLPWLLPIAGALALSIPASVLSSRVALGRRLRRARLFEIPEEAEPPPELRATAAYVENASRAADFTDAVVDPVVNALACAAGHAHPCLPQAVLTAHQKLVQTALCQGPAALTEPQKNLLLAEPLLLSQLHFEVWASPQAHILWREAIWI
jgi:membrane glycosyltransferase